MKRLTPVLCLLAVFALGADAATKPAEKKRLDGLDPANMVESNPEIEAIIKTIPKSLLPPTDGTKDDAVARNKKMREWDKANVDGKKISVIVYRIGTSGTVYYTTDGSEIRFSKTGKATLLPNIPPGQKLRLDGTIATKGGMLLLNNNHAIQYSFVLTDATESEIAK